MAASRWWTSGNYFTSYRQAQRLVATNVEWTLLAVGLLVLLVWPKLIRLENDTFLLINEVMTVIIALLGMNIITGFSGLVNLGHAGFLAIGAYTFFSVMSLTEGTGFDVHNFWPLVLIASGLAAAVTAAVVGLPSLRLKNLYLGMATLGFQIILDWAIRTQTFFQHGSALTVDRMSWFGSEISRREHNQFWYYTILAVLLLCIWCVRNLSRTQIGRRLFAIRENERAVESIGVAAGRYKVLSFAIGGFFAGLAGALQAMLFRTIEVGTFSLSLSIAFLCMATIGGLGTVKGCIFGAVALRLLDFEADAAVHALAKATGGDEVTLLAACRPALSGLFTLFLLHFQPLGFAYLWQQAKTRIMIWPRRP